MNWDPLSGLEAGPTQFSGDGSRHILDDGSRWVTMGHDIPSQPRTRSSHPPDCARYIATGSMGERGEQVGVACNPSGLVVDNPSGLVVDYPLDCVDVFTTLLAMSCAVT